MFDKPPLQLYMEYKPVDVIKENFSVIPLHVLSRLLLYVARQ